ncbi:hypothetical protein [Glaciihabitans sp. dw_435]|uniref:hypothetical protein n=1 Tax=Glaciihabitans sp. dw_435 TaxID=2720081 RepID=UPI001BD47935|nr:hypothetical protein [Glaciihabitans sp. dw_435]
MVNEARARELLGAPRGRRICAEVALAAVESLRPLLSIAEMDEEVAKQFGRSPTAEADLLDALATFPLETLGHLGELDLLLALSETTASGMYWQEPDDRDELLARPAVKDLLLPIAMALLDNHLTDSWASGVSDDQAFLFWRIREYPPQLKLTDIRSGVQLWQKRVIRQETESAAINRRHGRSWSGEWWSIPNPSGAPSTTGVTPEGTLGLWLVEDSAHEDEANVQELEILRSARVFEVTGADSWADLAARYPLVVTESKRNVWRQATGHKGPWLIPDWSAVADDYDAVHVSLWGHLVTAGMPIPVPGTESYTMLAGWTPDETYWFSDVLGPKGDIQLWERSDDEIWTRAS